MQAAGRFRPEGARHGAVPALPAQVARLVGAVNVLGAHKPSNVPALAAHLQGRGVPVCVCVCVFGVGVGGVGGWGGGGFSVKARQMAGECTRIPNSSTG